ncbi:hypothetical protein [Thalassotalea ganghwensis]
MNSGPQFINLNNKQLFCFARLPKNSQLMVVFIPPLFEDANNTRHAFTKLAEHLEKNKIASLIFDFSGTGDSEKELSEVSISDWFSELVSVCEHIREQLSAIKIAFFSCCSGALLLTPQVSANAENIVLWQPESSGKKYINQIKRLSKLQHTTPEYSNAEKTLLAGYEIPNKMLDDISELTLSSIRDKKVFWLEFSQQEKIPAAREVLFSSLHCLSSILKITTESKFWQATELTVPHQAISLTTEWLSNA